MKSLTLAIALGFVFVSLSFGSMLQCLPSWTYADLIALNGSGGCYINDKVFSNFSIGGDLTASQVTVENIIDNGPAAIGFIFEFNLSAFAGSTADLSIGYEIQTLSGAPTIISAFLGMVDGIIPPGAVAISENVCPGYSSSTCPTPLVLKTSDSGNGSPTLTSSVTFAPVSELYVLKDMTVAAGPGGLASLSVVTETVDQISPEPTTLALIGGALLGLGIFGSKRFSSRR